MRYRPDIEEPRKSPMPAWQRRAHCEDVELKVRQLRGEARGAGDDEFVHAASNFLEALKEWQEGW